MSAGTDIGASGSLSRARELMRQGALDAADAMVNDALTHAPRDADATPIAFAPSMRSARRRPRPRILSAPSSTDPTRSAPSSICSSDWTLTLPNFTLGRDDKQGRRSRRIVVPAGSLRSIEARQASER
ncbi:MAG TPA: hypothetical protein VN989_02395, partial [Casimicrobiaceae bacterium]|nr:hypothetical protein [Casimicrobiaceae bacterium]